MERLIVVSRDMGASLREVRAPVWVSSDVKDFQGWRRSRLKAFLPQLSLGGQLGGFPWRRAGKVLSVEPHWAIECTWLLGNCQSYHGEDGFWSLEQLHFAAWARVSLCLSVHGISSFAEWSRIVRQVIGQKVRPSFKKYACFLEVNFIP